MNARTLDTKVARLSPAEMRVELSRIELALEHARVSSNASVAQRVLEALIQERDLLQERLRQTLRR